MIVFKWLGTLMEAFRRSAEKEKRFTAATYRIR